MGYDDAAAYTGTANELNAQYWHNIQTRIHSLAPVRSLALLRHSTIYIGIHSPIYVYLGLTRKHSAVACLRCASTTHCWMGKWTKRASELHRKIEGYVCVWYTSNNFFNELVPTRLLTYISNWKFLEWMSAEDESRRERVPTNVLHRYGGMW